MGKILQFLQLFLVPGVLSLLQCKLKEEYESKNKILIDINIFDQKDDFETFHYSGPMSDKNKIPPNTVNGTNYMFKLGKITEYNDTEEGLLMDGCLVSVKDVHLFLPNTTGDLQITGINKTKLYLLSVIDKSTQYIIKKVSTSNNWETLNMSRFSEHLEIIHSNKTVLLKGKNKVYNFTEPWDLCIHLSSQPWYQCSEDKVVPASRNSSILKGHVKTEISSELLQSSEEGDIKTVLYSMRNNNSTRKCIKTTPIKNMTIQCLLPSWPEVENITFLILKKGILLRSKISYLNNPKIYNISPTDFSNCNETLIFTGEYFNNDLSISIKPDGLFNCSIYPTSPTTNFTIQCQLVGPRQHAGGEAVLHLDSIAQPFNYTIYDYPVYNFSEVHISSKTVVVYGERLNLLATKEDYNVTVNRQTCTIVSLSINQLECRWDSGDVDYEADYNIMITLQCLPSPLEGQPILAMKSTLHIIAIFLIGILIIFIVSLVFIKYREIQKKIYPIDSYLLENAQKCSTDVTEIDVPFQKITQYIERILLIEKPRGYKKNPGGKKLPFDIQGKLGHFEVLLKNKFFILNVIKAMERKKNICYNENYELSLHLCLLLSFNLAFLLELCEELFKDLIHHTKEKEMKKIMLRFESIVESLIKNWLALSLYPYIKFKFEPLLYNFVNKAREFLTQCPVDEVTGNSQHSFFKPYTITKPVAYRKINICAIYKRRSVELTVLTCDSISQLKTKCLVAYQHENINSVLPSLENIQLDLNGCALSEYTDETDSNGYSLLATAETYCLRDGDQLFIKKVVVESTANESRYVTLGECVSVVPTEVKKPCHLGTSEKSKPLSMIDILNMKLPPALDELLLELFSKMLEQANVAPPLKYIHNFFLHQASKFSLNDGNKWTINSYIIQMCSQFVAHPNILLDIPLDMCVQKQLAALQLYIKEAIMHPKSISSKTCHVGKGINVLVTKFLSQLNEQPELDKNDVIKSLQDASALYTNGITIYKEISLYSLLRILENNYVVIYKALEQDTTARKLCLHEKFSNIFH